MPHRRRIHKGDNTMTQDVRVVPLFDMDDLLVSPRILNEHADFFRSHLISMDVP